MEKAKTDTGTLADCQRELADCKAELASVRVAVVRMQKTWVTTSRVMFVAGGLLGAMGGYFVGRRQSGKEL